MKERGFTYVELGAALAIMMLLAGLVMPNVVRIERISREREFKTKLRALAALARTSAIQSGETAALGYDKGESTIQAMLEPAQGQAVVLGSLKLPDNVTVKQFSSDKDESPADGWRLPFFVDGTTSGGGAEFAIDGRPCSLLVPKGNADPRVVDEPMHDLSFDRWQAGSYASRS